jgi:hypothetical protein
MYSLQSQRLVTVQSCNWPGDLLPDIGGFVTDMIPVARQLYLRRMRPISIHHLRSGSGKRKCVTLGSAVALGGSELCRKLDALVERILRESGLTARRNAGKMSY